jgi:Glycosyl hydrolase family 3 N terminal domain
MCSYNRVDQKYACSNPDLLNGLLKGELGFKGYVMSDWWATHATSDAVAGLDMTMPGNKVSGFVHDSYFGAELLNLVKNGTIPESRVDVSTIVQKELLEAEFPCRTWQLESLLGFIYLDRTTIILKPISIAGISPTRGINISMFKMIMPRTLITSYMN